MCLITFNTKFKTAKKDIVVYKFFNKHKDKLTSLYYYKEWALNKEYKSEITYDILDTSNRDNLGKFILSSSVDSFSNIKNTKAFLKNKSEKFMKTYSGFYSFSNLFRAMLYNHPVGIVKIYKCIIPKGSKYIEDSNGSIVSDTLIVKKKLNLGILFFLLLIPIGFILVYSHIKYEKMIKKLSKKIIYS